MSLVSFVMGRVITSPSAWRRVSGRRWRRLKGLLLWPKKILMTEVDISLPKRLYFGSKHFFHFAEFAGVCFLTVPHSWGCVGFAGVYSYLSMPLVFLFTMHSMDHFPLHFVSPAWFLPSFLLSTYLSPPIPLCINTYMNVRLPLHDCEDLLLPKYVTWTHIF